MDIGPVKFELCIDDLDYLDSLFAERIFIGIWNSMARLFKECEITEAYQKVFDDFFPEENRANQKNDNAYVTLFEKMTKEICDKISPTIGKLPSGKVLYLNENEPITFDPKTGKGWLAGYLK